MKKPNSNQRVLLKYIAAGYYCEITSTHLKKGGNVWNIGLRRDVKRECNDFTGWGKTYSGALSKLVRSIIATEESPHRKIKSLLREIAQIKDRRIALKRMEKNILKSLDPEHRAIAILMKRMPSKVSD